MQRIRLDGWKAIAMRINRSTRQCQRLAESSGLPVHNIPGSRAIFAFADELDAWLAGCSFPSAPASNDASTHLTNSGRHIVIPLDVAEAASPAGIHTSPGESKPPAPVRPDGEPHNPHGRPDSHRRSHRKRIIMTVTITAVLLVTLVWGIHFRQETAWRALGAPLTGAWTFANGGVAGKAQSVGRFNTGSMIGPGSSAAVTLTSGGTRWAGGLEIFEDDLHWTFVAMSPRQHEIVVECFPAGTVNTFFAGSTVSAGKPVRLAVILTDKALRIFCGGIPVGTVRLHRWDIERGRLVLRVGSPGDELHPPTGGDAFFTALHVTGALTSLPPTTVTDVPRRLWPSATYTLIADNIDDQLDVLLDGKRLATAGYREKIGPLVINRFLTRGKHTLCMRLFNRKWSAAYGIRLEENGVDIWNERCGNVRSDHAACDTLKTRLGMVKQLDFTFRAR